MNDTDGIISSHIMILHGCHPATRVVVGRNEEHDGRADGPKAAPILNVLASSSLCAGALSAIYFAPVCTLYSARPPALPAAPSSTWLPHSDQGLVALPRDSARRLCPSRNAARSVTTAAFARPESRGSCAALRHRRGALPPQHDLRVGAPISAWAEIRLRLPRSSPALLGLRGRLEASACTALPQPTKLAAIAGWLHGKSLFTVYIERR